MIMSMVINFDFDILIGLLPLSLWLDLLDYCPNVLTLTTYSHYLVSKVRRWLERMIHLHDDVQMTMYCTDFGGCSRYWLITVSPSAATKVLCRPRCFHATQSSAHKSCTPRKFSRETVKIQLCWILTGCVVHTLSGGFNKTLTISVVVNSALPHLKTGRCSHPM